jgi:CRP/FNR family transcriptional regulator, cyclic AMP receptor protein
MPRQPECRLADLRGGVEGWSGRPGSRAERLKPQVGGGRPTAAFRFNWLDEQVPGPGSGGVTSRADVDLHQRTAVLARSELFQGIDGATQRRIAGMITERVVEQGQTLFLQGEAGDRLFILAEGTVKLYVSSRSGGVVELVRHRPPAMFGEVALLDGGPRSASAQAVERSTVLVVTRAELLRLLQSEQVAAALLRSLGTIVRRTTRQVTDLVFLDLQGRVARRLLELAAEGGNGASTRCVTQGELATMVGGARQTVNQALRSLESRGFIRAAGRSFEIVDRERLERLADR